MSDQRYPACVVLTPAAVYHCGTLAEARERAEGGGVIYVPTATAEQITATDLQRACVEYGREACGRLRERRACKGCGRGMRLPGEVCEDCAGSRK